MRCNNDKRILKSKAVQGIVNSSDLSFLEVLKFGCTKEHIWSRTGIKIPEKLSFSRQQSSVISA